MFLAASLAGIASVSLASCTDPAPTPPTSPTRVPTTPPTSAAPTPVPGVPEPSAFRRTNWGADLSARGAFSFDAVGSTPELRERLATPIDGRIFIAGEATSTESFGTVDGAYTEGVRVADEVSRRAARDERIAVIGAGLTGLIAASRLVADGYDAVVFESRARLGGRLHSADDGGFDAPIQLGSPFFGSSAALRAELLTASVETSKFTPSTRLHRGDGSPLEPDDLGWRVIAAAQKWAKTRPADMSLAAALERTRIEPVSPLPDEQGVSAAEWVQHTFDSGVAPATGASRFQVSAQRFDREATAERTAFAATTSWQPYLDALAEPVDIAASSAVSAVALAGDRVSLRLDTGESFRADRVIVTVPLGVLKAGTIQFDPPLPLEHRRAISTLGFGVIDFAWLRFDEPFWRDSLAAVSATSVPPADAATGTPFVFSSIGDIPLPADEDDPIDDAEAGTPAAATVAAFIDLGMADGTLIAVLAGPSALSLEQFGDDDVRAAVLNALRPFVPAE